MLEKDKLSSCPHCGGDACYIQQVTDDISIKQCFGCGMASNSVMVHGSEFFDLQMEALPELHKDLIWKDPKTGEVWIPQTVNIPNKGMVFANGVSKDSWNWAAVLAVPVTDEEKLLLKYPKPGKKESYDFRMDMSTKRDFEEKDFIEGLEYIGMFKQ
jgi:hypothetical protein